MTVNLILNSICHAYGRINIEIEGKHQLPIPFFVNTTQTLIEYYVHLHSNKLKQLQSIKPIALRGRRGIESNTGLNPFLKIALNVFCLHKT